MNNNLHTQTPSAEPAVRALPPSVCTMPSGGTMAELLAMMGVTTGDQSAAARVPVAVRRVTAGEQLVHEGTPAKALYFVGAGTFKIFHTHIDGYEQVLAFAGRGEVLGFDALCMESHPTAITALEDSRIYVVLIRELHELSVTVPAFGLALQRVGSLSLMRSRELADVMAAVASEVRTARFLMHMSQRMAAAGQSPRRFRLRMGRRDIASLLGVAHETVSRSFTALSMLGLLHVSDREIEILDMEGLAAFSRNTRRRTEDIFDESNQAMNGRRRSPARRGRGRGVSVNAIAAA
jgi:CRP/FNR family transcriptional regulator, anaerobic regulatory protein